MGLFDTYKNILGTGIASIGNTFNLPEFGISEAITGSKSQTAPLLGSINPIARATTPNQASTGQVQGASTQSPTGLPNGRSGFGEILNPPPTVNVNDATAGNYGTYGAGAAGQTAQNNALQSIEDNYNANIQGLNNQQTDTQSQYGIAGQQLQNQYTASQGNIQGLKSDQLGQLNQAVGTTNTAANNATNDARRAYNELQQKQNAQLSASGLGSSSVNEAMTENLGRQTFNALNSINQNKQQTLGNIETQKTSTTDFYNRQLSQLEQSLGTAKDQISAQLQSALNGITQAKSLAENQKSQARNQVIQGAQAAYQQASAQAAQYQQALDSWNSTKNQILDLAGQHTNGDIGVNQLMAGLQAANQKLQGVGSTINIPAFLQGLASPQVGASGLGTYIQPYDPNANLYAQTQLQQAQASLKQTQGQNKAAGY